MNKKLIFGLGTGRCGTVSLSELLNIQAGFAVTHESEPLLPWEFDKKAIEKKLEQLLQYEGAVVGDVAFYYLPYVEYILSGYANAKFICLKRDKAETLVVI